MNEGIADVVLSFKTYYETYIWPKGVPPIKTTWNTITIPTRFDNLIDDTIKILRCQPWLQGIKIEKLVNPLSDDTKYIFSSSQQDYEFEGSTNWFDIASMYPISKDEKPKYDYSKLHLFDTASMHPDCIKPHRFKTADIDCIKKVIFSGPCTIILWNDGTKTIVRCGQDDEFDKEKGIAMCILKKMFGSSHQMSKWMKEQIGEEEEEQGFKLPPFFYADDKKIDL